MNPTGLITGTPTGAISGSAIAAGAITFIARDANGLTGTKNLYLNSSLLAPTPGFGNGWKQLAGTCGIKADGTAWCWGPGYWGGLGNGTRSNSSVPVRVAGGGTWQSMTHSGDGDTTRTCGIKTDFSAWCWGDNTNGGLGNGSSSFSAVPSKVAGDGAWKSLVTVGTSKQSYMCGIQLDGSAWCWGYGGEGNLGNTSYSDSSIPVTVAGEGAGVPLTTTGVAPCGIKTDGSAWCWGPSDWLGNGTSTGSSSPVRVVG